MDDPPICPVPVSKPSQSQQGRFKKQVPWIDIDSSSKPSHKERAPETSSIANKQQTLKAVQPTQAEPRNTATSTLVRPVPVADTQRIYEGTTKASVSSSHSGFKIKSEVANAASATMNAVRPRHSSSSYVTDESDANASDYPRGSSADIQFHLMQTRPGVTKLHGSSTRNNSGTGTADQPFVIDSDDDGESSTHDDNQRITKLSAGFLTGAAETLMIDTSQTMMVINKDIVLPSSGLDDITKETRRLELSTTTPVTGAVATEVTRGSNIDRVANGTEQGNPSTKSPKLTSTTRSNSIQFTVPKPLSSKDGTRTITTKEAFSDKERPSWSEVGPSRTNHDSQSLLDNLRQQVSREDILNTSPSTSRDVDRDRAQSQSTTTVRGLDISIPTTKRIVSQAVSVVPPDIAPVQAYNISRQNPETLFKGSVALAPNDRPSLEEQRRMRRENEMNIRLGLISAEGARWTFQSLQTGTTDKNFGKTTWPASTNVSGCSHSLQPASNQTVSSSASSTVIPDSSKNTSATTPEVESDNVRSADKF